MVLECERLPRQTPHSFKSAFSLFATFITHLDGETVPGLRALFPTSWCVRVGLEVVGLRRVGCKNPDCEKIFQPFTQKKQNIF